MCRTIRFSEGPSLDKIEASYNEQMAIEEARKKKAAKAKEKAKKGEQVETDTQEKPEEKEKVTFPTTELGEITGVIMTLDKLTDVHVMKLLVERIGQEEVPDVKLWTVFYIDAHKAGTIYCENKAQEV